MPTIRIKKIDIIRQVSDFCELNDLIATDAKMAISNSFRRFIGDDQCILSPHDNNEIVPVYLSLDKTHRLTKTQQNQYMI
jgi:hypothetical protein